MTAKTNTPMIRQFPRPPLEARFARGAVRRSEEGRQIHARHRQTRDDSAATTRPPPLN